MAHFYTTAQGNHGETSRCGSKASGATATVSGWDIGGTVDAYYSHALGTDVISFTITHGSNRGNSGKRVISFAKVDGELKVIDTDYPEILV